ncbi:carboxypeptidase-like regulatory domain-containing protein [Aquimarina intermedia]|uniref:Carboxypeptidase-like protein n=1 Tax=Aquimarina intermedia TaxID=350814 RepID=A0A5S5BYT3_9FLAO|nr:carboxypeptidase-like regulatory domain-containing protein [Aquimarina intermedia]TYP72204.1 carboxypeptidase-like protein [Aquimarina intermedia]
MKTELMKKYKKMIHLPMKKLSFIFLVICFSFKLNAFQVEAQESSQYQLYTGTIEDKSNNDALPSATVILSGTNISTVSNASGEFSIKVPYQNRNANLIISYLGYKNKTVSLVQLQNMEDAIQLERTVTELDEVSIGERDAKEIMKQVIKKIPDNYLASPIIQTAFYRETIRKRRTYVSLSEAVIDIYKNPSPLNKVDDVKLFKARKNTDYKRLDTLTLKLQGGPASALYLDLVKHPEALLSNDILDSYIFTMDKSVRMNNRNMYVINFKQHPNIPDPMYYGKLYIDVTTYALTKASFSLNLENRKEASKIFVRKKPARAKVYATQADYTVNYREDNNKWYYGYSKMELAFKINWKKRLFNSVYKLDVELAVTDWKENVEKKSLKAKERLKPSTILSDKASGFSEPDFWGEYNIIEPEKSIESAIKKIQKQLKKREESR